jgi:hypothetical protein
MTDPRTELLARIRRPYGLEDLVELRAILSDADAYLDAHPGDLELEGELESIAMLISGAELVSGSAPDRA